MNNLHLQKPNHALWYVNDINTDMYINNLKVKKGNAEFVQGKLVLSNWVNSVVYEIYDEEYNLIMITMDNTVSLPSQSDKYYIRGISSDSSYEEIIVERN